MESSATSAMPTIRELSSIAVENNPTKIAYAEGIDGRAITWAAFDKRSKRAANGLREHVGQGDRVAHLCEGSIDHVTLWNGALKAGCLVSNLHVRESPETTRSCIDSLRPRVLVVDEERSAFVEAHVYDRISTDLAAVVTTGEPQTDYEVSMDDLLADQPAEEPDVNVGPDDPAAVIWTSGTTGEPKGWTHTNRALMHRGSKLAHKKGMTRRTRVPNVFSPSFAAWYSTTLPALLSNASSYFLPDWEPERYVQCIEERSITTANLVPTMWREILRLENVDEYDLSSLREIEAAGETLDATTLTNLREHICETVSQSYAATETCGTNISNDEIGDDRLESVGKPLLGIQIRVVQEGSDPDDVMEPGEIGEVIVKSSDSAAWIWGDTAKTENAFVDGWWYSGDLGYKDEEGYLYIEGRDDNMILSKGLKVFPAPIEERLNTHPDVVETGVVGVDDEEYGEKVTAVVTRDDPDLTADELDEWCLESDKLSRFERPRAYHFRDETLPRTSSDKLDRQSIREQLEAER
ncbi:MAG: class I adenylate-forming enzyme family protein [Halobellus sp.]|uniref:class I adenylate-forming enzyme family protein n=1 Tax=Halobellus sp. TaxID=1979212 RepID=UPI0035D46867